MIRPLALAAFLLVAPCGLAWPALAQTPAAAGGHALTLTFEPGATAGTVMAALYDSQAAYDGGRPVRAVRIDIAAGARQAVIADLPAGTYAVKAFHDLNGNGEMDANPFGMPVEPFAFSNNAVGNMGPASWDRARFDVAGATAQTIRIR